MTIPIGMKCWICNLTCGDCEIYSAKDSQRTRTKLIRHYGVKYCENVENHYCYLVNDSTQCIPLCPVGCNCQHDKELYKCNENSIPFIPRDARALDFSHSLFRIDELEDEWMFLIYLNLSHCFVTNISLFEHKNNFRLLRVLDLRYNQIERISKLKLPLLEELYLDGNPLYSIDIGVQLRKLSLSGVKMQPTILRNDSALTSLTFPANFRADLKSESKLVSLSLSRNFIQNITGFCFRCSSLTRLDLSHNKIDKLSLTSFSGISSLKYLSLRGNRITVIKLEYLLNVCTLGELDLGQNMIYSIENNAFDRLLQLMILHLDHNRLLHIPARLFRHNKYMHLLNVANNQIIDDIG